MLLAVYFYRAHRQEMREAEQRVTFVNQVSHELKTPLTNIRLYAEMAEDKIQAMDLPEGSKLQHCLDVVTEESQRLSRLIANVLAFAKQKRGEAVLRPRAGSVDAIIASAVEIFRPTLTQKGIRVELVSKATQQVMVDPDVLSQIIANLVSNVEKYASSGGLLRITSHQEGDTTEIHVEDHGPGIPKGQLHRVFLPFVRLSHRVSDGVAGTGIGLSIARQHARLHGGDLTLQSTGQGAGCRFVLSIHTPSASSNSGATSVS
jgi:signal transduction histidine kinase